MIIILIYIVKIIRYSRLNSNEKSSCRHKFSEGGMMTYFQTFSIDNEKVQIELTQDLLSKIITSGLISADQLKCLNNSTKKALWKTILKSSEARLNRMMPKK